MGAIKVSTSTKAIATLKLWIKTGKCINKNYKLIKE